MAENQKPKISIKGVQDDLANGLTREEIGKKYGLSNPDTKALFQHPKLKGLKTKVKKELGFEIEDDAPERKSYAKKASKAEGGDEITDEDGSKADTEVESSETDAKEETKEEAPAKKEAAPTKQKGVW